MRRYIRAFIALAFVVALGLGAVELVRGANGDFRSEYKLTGYFPRAGEGLHPGSEVVFRGVQIGRVSTIALSGGQAKITVLIEPDFKVPVNATATVQPVNLFGAEQVSLTTPGGNPDNPPYLAHGATFAHAASASELNDLFRAAAPLLNQINTVQLASLLSELGQASNGEGPRIAKSIDEGARLATFLDATLNAQLKALNSFARFNAAIAADGPVLNALSQQENLALPVFNQDVADYQRLQDNLIGFSNQLAQILADYHPDIATLLSAGDNVARLVTAQQKNIGEVIQGAYQYAVKLGHGASADTLPDGSKYSYFNTFILFSDVNSLVCSLIAPAAPGLTFLQPLQQALTGAGSPFNCSSQMAQFNAAQFTLAAPGSTTPTTTPGVSPTTRSDSLAQQLTNEVFGLLGRPSKPGSGSLGGYINGLLGGGQ